MTYQQLASIILIFGIGGTATAVSDAFWADTLFCLQPDPKTSLTCEQVKNDPEIDVYYIVNQTHINDQELFSKAHQHPETVRWNNAHSQFILKYDGLEVPRGQVGALLGLNNPKSHDQIMQTLNSQAWEIDPNSPITKIRDSKTFVEDNNFVPE